MTDEGNFEIGRVLHLKPEIRNLKLDLRLAVLPSNLRFRISGLRCRTRPIPDCSGRIGASLQRKVDRNGGDHFYWFTIQERRLVLPLLNRIDRGVIQQRMPGDYPNILNASISRNCGFEYHDAVYMRRTS